MPVELCIDNVSLISVSLQASSMSSITDSTMSLNVMTVTLNMGNIAMNHFKGQLPQNFNLLSIPCPVSVHYMGTAFVTMNCIGLKKMAKQ